MGKFLTSKSRIEQTAIEGIWYTLDNQLYKDDDGTIYLTPRNTLTDGYTTPQFLTPIVGGRYDHDVRCCVGHDFECYYRKVITVNLTEFQLKKLRFLHCNKDNKWVCENIPLELLTIKDTTFRETNKRFMRMLKSVSNMSKMDTFLIGNAVNLNIGWWLKEPHTLHTDRLYRIDYEQVR